MSGTAANLVEMVSCGLQRTLPLMLQRKWGDPEITDDLQELDTAVQKQIHDMRFIFCVLSFTKQLV